MSEWIEHDGQGCPLAKGTNVTLRCAGGAIYTGVIGTGVCVSIDGEIKPASATSGQKREGNCWIWASMPSGFHDFCVVAYRLRNDGAEAKTRKARISNFRKIADDALIGDKPVKAPEKESV